MKIAKLIDKLESVRSRLGDDVKVFVEDREITSITSNPSKVTLLTKIKNFHEVVIDNTEAEHEETN